MPPRVPDREVWGKISSDAGRTVASCILRNHASLWGEMWSVDKAKLPSDSRVESQCSRAITATMTRSKATRDGPSGPRAGQSHHTYPHCHQAAPGASYFGHHSTPNDISTPCHKPRKNTVGRLQGRAYFLYVHAQIIEADKTDIAY